MAATTIGTSSFGAMVTEDHDSGHCSWNQEFSWMTPQPHVPDASDTKRRGIFDGGMMLVPFQVLRNVRQVSPCCAVEVDPMI